MTIVTINNEGQLRIPEVILRKLGAKPNNQLKISLKNREITIAPVEQRIVRKKNNLMSFAGIGQGCCGHTNDEVNYNIQSLRDSWSR